MNYYKVLPPVLRYVQCVCALITLSTTAGGFPVTNGAQLWHPAFSFILLTSFSAWIITLLWIIAVKGLHQAEPTEHVMALIDGIMAIFFFSGGIATTTSTLVRSCDILALRCSTIYTSIVFDFFGFAAHTGSFILCYLVRGGHIPNYALSSMSPEGQPRTPLSSFGPSTTPHATETPADCSRVV